LFAQAAVRRLGAAGAKRDTPIATSVPMDSHSPAVQSGDVRLGGVLLSTRSVRNIFIGLSVLLVALAFAWAIASSLSVPFGDDQADVPPLARGADQTQL
jgi:hypothetical protein